LAALSFGWLIPAAVVFMVVAFDHHEMKTSTGAGWKKSCHRRLFLYDGISAVDEGELI
jgi:hypothetical protein